MEYYNLYKLNHYVVYLKLIKYYKSTILHVRVLSHFSRVKGL